VGLMFVPESPRLIGMARARELAAVVGPLMQTVGVFRNAPLQQVLDTAGRLRLGAVQLHGDEDAAYIRAVSRSFRVIRALSFSPALTRAEVEADPADAVLIDGLRPGGGESFDWSAAGELRGLPRLILAGGLNPENVAQGIRALRPYGVDVSSGVEERAGVKDPEMIRAFVSMARAAEAEPVR
jgi:phosphoribosylanthranilate isomerase